MLDAVMSVQVLQAETGKSFSVPVESAAASVGSLQTTLEPASGVPYAHQILILEGTKLDDTLTLGEYQLPSHDRPVFLFSRRSLSRNASPPERQAIPPFELDVPGELAPSQQPRPALAVSSPLVKALFDYERNFCLHLVQARTISEVGGARVAASSQCMHELAVQGAAQRAAVMNLMSFANQLAERYAEFDANCKQVVQLQAELVHTFEEDIEALRTAEIDEAVCELEGWSHATLLESCGEDRLRSWLRECQHNTEHLVTKAAQFATLWSELQVPCDPRLHRRAYPWRAPDERLSRATRFVPAPRVPSLHPSCVRQAPLAPVPYLFPVAGWYPSHRHPGRVHGERWHRGAPRRCERVARAAGANRRTPRRRCERGAPARRRANQPRVWGSNPTSGQWREQPQDAPG